MMSGFGQSAQVMLIQCLMTISHLPFVLFTLNRAINSIALHCCWLSVCAIVTCTFCVCFVLCQLIYHVCVLLVD